MKKFRKISALILALALICTLAVSAFAVTTGSSVSVWCYDVRFHTEMLGTVSYAKATAKEDVIGDNDYSMLVTLSYTICPEDLLRPTYYETGSVTATFTSLDTDKSKTYSAPRGYVMIDATGKTKTTQTVSGAVYTTTTAPVTIDLY